MVFLMNSLHTGCFGCKNRVPLFRRLKSFMSQQEWTRRPTLPQPSKLFVRLLVVEYLRFNIDVIFIINYFLSDR
jgi:hypothetical protein